MYVSKSIKVLPGASERLKFELKFAVELLAVWVRPGDIIGNPCLYEFWVRYSGAEQLHLVRTVAMIDKFKDDLVPGGQGKDRYPLQVEVEVKNNDTESKVFWIAFVTKSLLGEL